MTTTQQGSGSPPDGGLSEEQLRQIGRIAVAHAFLELAAMMLVARLVHEDIERGLAVVRGDPLRTQLERISRLIGQPRVDDHDAIEPGLRRAIAEWVDEVGQVKDERNRVLHSVWVGSAIEGGPSIGLSFRRDRTQFHELTDEDMWAIQALLGALADEGMDLFHRLTGGQFEEVDPASLIGGSDDETSSDD